MEGLSTERSGELVAKSPAMRRVLELAGRAAPSDATVLVTGESGVGKERIARIIHERSRRCAGPFLALNCAALPESLIETELFGHVKGSFTGASSDKQGLFEAAEGGTLLLDEIGETSPAVQVRLLRALQEHTVRPVGATQDVPVNVRIIAATNRNLEALVQEKTFRKDLLYRLRVIQLEVPPLRDRREDILPLALQFIRRCCTEHSCGPCSLNPAALDMLMAYEWPGNVRELENAIERAVVLAEGKPRIEPGDLPPEVRERQTARGAPSNDRILTLAEVEREHIIAVLDRLNGNRKETAKALGIGESTLWRKLSEYGLVRRHADRPHSSEDSSLG